MAQRECHQLGDAFTVGDPVGPFGDRGGRGDLVESPLQWVGLLLAQRGCADDEQHRYRVEVGVDDRGVDVGEAGTRRHDAHPRALGYAGPGVGRVPGGRLVASVGEPNPVVGAGHEERIQVTAVQRENIADLGLFEGLSKQLSAGDRH